MITVIDRETGDRIDLDENTEIDRERDHYRKDKTLSTCRNGERVTIIAEACGEDDWEAIVLRPKR